ncbi:RmlC-like cupin domain-containing protein [Xylaria sp. FL1777]|nr:RmlC-like cupin domain-containing protein [Xylaria sp. FL1777]
MATVSIPLTFASFTETWSPRLVAAVNNHHVKIAKIDGAFIFHAHPDSDELFYLVSGELTLEIESGAQEDDEAKPRTVEAVVLKVGDLYVVPKGVRHRPVAKNAEILMIERNDTVNTGDAEDQQRRKVPLDVRGQ